MTDEKEKIYEEHKSQIFRSKSFDDYSADEIEEAFSRVLMYLPNDAKLYKYRKFEEKSFNRNLSFFLSALKSLAYL